jgi:CHAT domain-containing protein
LNDFTNDSHALYEFLLKNSLLDLPKDVNSLMIIPDGKLTYFPFELLLPEKPKKDAVISYSSSAMPYLFNNYNISYGFSATVVNLTHQKTKQSNTGAPAIFAPSFSNEYIAENRSCQEDNLSYLQCNTTEGERIKSLISGDIFTGDLASIQKFRQVASNSSILHLATHACVDEENADGNKIFFTDTYLTNEDLNTVGVNADLVVLSACDTGLGKLIKGEGLMSLSRGFLCAGAASTVMSLWSVDDCATSDLMVNFYKELKDGKDKSTALKNAKLNYLAQADKLHQHPYFWAPFVLSGNVNPIESIASTSSFLYFGLGAVFLLLLAFFGYQRMKN